jgi:hypothetical protein
MEGSMKTAANGRRRSRGFFNSLSRAYQASFEFQRLSGMSDRALAERNLTRDQIPQYIASRLDD